MRRSRLLAIGARLHLLLGALLAMLIAALLIPTWSAIRSGEVGVNAKHLAEVRDTALSLNETINAMNQTVTRIVQASAA